MKYDAIVVGSGPNGMAAAITLAQSGRSVLIREASETPGGGLKSESLTLPGFLHDVCSAVHPLAVTSPFFRNLPLEQYGLKWIYPPASLAQPLRDGRAALLWPSIEKTIQDLGVDAESYRNLFGPYVSHWEELFEGILQPLVSPRALFKHPVLMTQFGLKALMPAQMLIRRAFRTEAAQTLFAGIASHSCLPLSWLSSSAAALVLGIAGHAKGWPIPEGGSGRISEALIAYFRSLGGTLETGVPVRALSDLKDFKWIFLDLTPRQIVNIAGTELSDLYLESLKGFTYGPGVFKMDFALSAPVPWIAYECRQSATVHVSESFSEMQESEQAPFKGQISSKPYVLLAQPSLFDASRAPAGKHTVWAYCHVPQGFAGDVSQQIEDQIERFAPGFKRLILAKSVRGPRELEAHNGNLVGGDISGGLASFRQMIFRPVMSSNPYATSNPRIWICSSSTPPGPGVHGMCGYNAVKRALRLT